VGKHVVQFLHVFFLVHQVFGLMGSQIKIKWIFSVANVITNLRQSRLEIENLDRLIFNIKNWPSYVRVMCDGPLKPKVMVEFLEKDFALIEKHIRLIKEQDFFEEDSKSDLC